jgi:hypothetical protein
MTKQAEQAAIACPVAFIVRVQLNPTNPDTTSHELPHATDPMLFTALCAQMTLQVVCYASKTDKGLSSCTSSTHLNDPHTSWMLHQQIIYHTALLMLLLVVWGLPTAPLP